jgi:hypothetical protein
MARQSFRGAGGAGAVVLPYECGGTASEYEVDATIPRYGEADRRLEGALAIVASGVLVVIGIFVAGWTFAG